MNAIQAAYPDSDDDVGKEGAARRRLPLPVHVQQGTTRLWIDEPAEHGHRRRRLAHFQGHFPSSVFLPAPFVESASFAAFKQALPTTPTLTFEHDLHLSLSKLFMLRRHEISPFVQAIADAINDIGCFSIVMTDPVVFVNDDRSRTFAAMETPSRGPIMALLDAIDSVMSRFGLPTYYRPARPHVSFAWIIGDHHDELLLAMDRPLDPFHVDVDRVQIGIGDKIYPVALEHDHR